MYLSIIFDDTFLMFYFLWSPFADLNSSFKNGAMTFLI